MTTRRLCCYLEPTGFGGSEQWLGFLLGGIDARYEVELVTTDEDIAREIARARPGTVVRAVPQVERKFDVGAIRAHRQAFAQARPDLTLVSHGQLYACQYGIVTAWPTRRPVVSVVHCVLPRTDALQAVLMRGASKLVTRFVGVSNAVAGATEAELHLRPGSITVIHNGVPEPGPMALAPAAGERARPVLGCVGRLTDEKGYDVALRALVQLPDCELVILGEGARLGELQQLAASLGVLGRVHFEGAVPWPWAEHRRFDVLLVPSRYEGFGLVVVEAMLAGIPVVATNVAGLAEVVTDEKTGLLVDPDRPEQLAWATRRMLDDAALRHEVAARGREEARARFGVAGMVAAYESLFDELLGAGRQGRLTG